MSSSILNEEDEKGGTVASNLNGATRLTSSTYSLNSLTTILSNEKIMNSSRKLSTLKKQNTTDTYLQDFITLEPQPQLNLILNYSLYLNEKLKVLQVKVISLENVKLPESLSSSNIDLNVYVRIELLAPLAHNIPITERKTAKTRLIKNRSNPIFDESFEFTNLTDLFVNLMSSSDEINENSEEFKRNNSFRLVFNVCNSNLFGRDQIIGQTVHTVLKIDLFNNEFINKAIILNEKENSNDKLVNSDNNNNNNPNLINLPRIYSRKVDLVDSKVVFLFF